MHNLCDQCETVAHCLTHGCIPLQPVWNTGPTNKDVEAALQAKRLAKLVSWNRAGAMPPEQEAAYNLAPWLSAALDDPNVCQEYKDAVNSWFDTAMPSPPAVQWQKVECPFCGDTVTATDMPAAQRPWTGLTPEERQQHRDDWHSNIHDKEFQAIEAKLQEKNT